MSMTREEVYAAIDEESERDETLKRICDYVRNASYEEMLIVFAVIFAVHEQNGDYNPENIEGHSKGFLKKVIRQARIEQKDAPAEFVKSMEDGITYIRKMCKLGPYSQRKGEALA